MLKAILAGTTALVIAGSSLVYAQQRQGRPELGRGQPNIEDMRAFAEARLGALKAGLMLTPDQERNWPAFEQAARELAKTRLDRVNAFMTARRDRQQPNSADPTERLHRRAAVMSETGAALKKLADATDPLYKSLDDSQKRRFAVLSRLGGRDGRGGRELRGREDGPRGFDRRSRRTEFAPDGSDRDRRPESERGVRPDRGSARGGRPARL